MSVDTDAWFCQWCFIKWGYTDVLNRGNATHCYKCSASKYSKKGATDIEQAAAVSVEETGVAPRRKKKRGGRKHKKARDPSQQDLEATSIASDSEEEIPGSVMYTRAPSQQAPTAGRGAKRPLTEAEKAREGRSRRSGVACKEPYAHLASLSYAFGVLIIGIAVLTRTYESFDFVVTAVDESAGEIAESVATDIQWFSKTIIQMLLVCAVTVVAIATERCVSIFKKPLETPAQ